MATRSRPHARTRPAASATAPAAPAPTPLLQSRLVIEYLDINDIVPYEWNPRQNAEAVAAVASSMRLTQGFAMPVVVDADNVLIAGHTRIEAAKSLGMLEAPVVRLSHLTPEQVNAFRIIDNKVAEQARWDFELLAGEIMKLESTGLDWTQFGWTQNEIDCLSDLVAADCLDATTLVPETASANPANVGRRAPQTSRFVLGELVFFLPLEQYRHWIDGLRQLHNFSEEAMAEDIKRRLGVLE